MVLPQGRKLLVAHPCAWSWRAAWLRRGALIGNAVPPPLSRR